MTTVTINDAKIQFWASKEAYLEFKKQWAKLAKEKKITSTMIIFYNIVRGKQFSNGFTPITNPIKIANGADKNLAFKQALSNLRYTIQPPHKYAEASRGEFIEMFEGTIDNELMEKIKVHLKELGI